MTLRNIIFASLVASAVGHAQISVRHELVRLDVRTSDILVHIGLSGRQDSLRWSALTTGEPTRQDAAGRRIISRLLALRLPSETFGLSATRSTVRSVPVLDVPEDSTAERGTPFEGIARSTSLAPSRDGYDVLIEYIIATLNEEVKAVEIPTTLRLRIRHDPWPAEGGGSILPTPWTDAAPGFSAAPKRSTTLSLFAVGDLYTFQVTETGMYRLTRAWFLQSGVAESELGQIGRFRFYGNGGAPIPEDITAARPQGPAELPRFIDDKNANGTLDEEDAVIVFCTSVRRWSYASANRQFSHTINPYTERNSYFFRFDMDSSGREMSELASLGGAAGSVPHVLGRIAVDDDRVNFVHSGRNWVGNPFDVFTTTSVLMNALPGYEGSQPIDYRAYFYSRSSTPDTFRLAEHGIPLGGPVIMSTADVSSVDQLGNYAAASGIRTFRFSEPLTEARSVLRISFGIKNQGAKGWLDWLEIFYRRLLQADEDRLFFPTPDTTATLSYTVRNLSSRATMVFDVSDHMNVKRLTGLEFDPVDASMCTFRLSHTSGSVSEIAVVGQNGYRSPEQAKKVPSSNLRGFAGPATFIIISPAEFLEEAERLAAHRMANDGIATMVVDVASVFNEFGGGQPDPMAIRDFLAFARDYYGGALHYVLLFGNGHYDYRNISTSARNWIVPYETVESNYQILTYTSDDHFVRLNPGNSRTSLAIGRLPARTLNEVRGMVDKIIRYDTQSPLDPWRNRMTFVADDGQTSTNPNENEMHTRQSETLAITYTPASFEKRRIYSVEYPTVLTASGRRKPDVNEEIVRTFNNGTLVLNFIGHGNTRLWTHEAIFTREAEIPRLTNADRLTLLVAATCNYAQWDDHAEQSSGELLVAKPDGGAIGVVTATRSVFSNQNARLNQELYTWLMSRDSAGASLRLGEAMRMMKQVLFDENAQKYHLLGDPTLRLLRPQRSLSIDSINGVSTSTVSTVPTLGVTRVSGVIRNSANATDAGFNGTGLIELFDSRQTVVVPEWNYSFEKSGSVLYRGEISITNGVFSAQFPVPKDVTYGGQARISVYGIGGGVDAVGTTEQLFISGTDSSAVADSAGPEIRIYFETTSFSAGDVVPPEPTIIVTLADVSGINTSTIGIGHRLEAVIQPEGRVVDLSGDYRGDLDTYQSGRAMTRLAPLDPGRHTVLVRAWDIFNNSSTEEVAFDVRDGSTADVFQVMNVPNPFTRSTAFTFQRVTDDPVNITVKVYTVAGRVIQELQQWSVVDRFVRIPWNGRDRDGNDVANGVYLYKVFVRSADGSASSETIGKLARVR